MRFSRRRYRTVCISDVHLGFRGCGAEHLFDFPRLTECEYLYLVGDIIDIWSVKKWPFWPQTHNDVARTILGKSRYGTRVIFVPGNHDEFLRDHDGMVFGTISMADRAVRERADGHRFLVLHGDVVYCNCGDWVESHTALVQHPDGTFEVLHWSDTLASRMCPEAAAA